MFKSNRKTSPLFTFFLLGFLFMTPPIFADQPHMDKALDQLKEAREQLQKATHDKGGHRTKALQLVNRAIAQVEMGIKYDRRN